MSSNRLRRIAKEIEDTRSDTWSKVSLGTAGHADDLTHLEGSFYGPPDTPYEGGLFIVDIVIPNDYPFKPPQMKFKTKIWHPNVSSQTGAICLDTLSTNWSPVLTIKSALISLQGLLASPEPKDPQDAEVASMMLKNPKEFEKHAHDWAVKYAGATRKDEHVTGGEASGQADGSNLEALKKKQDLERYGGYSPALVDRFVQLGFDIPVVVNALNALGFGRNNGQDYDLNDEAVEQITGRLFGES